MIKFASNNFTFFSLRKIYFTIINYTYERHHHKLTESSYSYTNWPFQSVPTNSPIHGTAKIHIKDWNEDGNARSEKRIHQPMSPYHCDIQLSRDERILKKKETKLCEYLLQFHKNHWRTIRFSYPITKWEEIPSSIFRQCKTPNYFTEQKLTFNYLRFNKV